MGKGGKSAERIVVVTDQFLIKIDTKKNKVMDKEPLSVITGLSILDYDSSKIGKCFFFLRSFNFGSAIFHCSSRNDLVMIFSSGLVVDLAARMTSKIKVNLLPGPVPVQFEKKTINLTRGDSSTGQLHYDKGMRLKKFYSKLSTYSLHQCST